MIQFYCRDIADRPVLDESDSRHCVRVLRMNPGERLEVVDGRGHRYACRLVDAHPKHALLEIERTEAVAKAWQGEITIAVAPTKHLDRMEWLVEKLTETGVDRIVPLCCDRSERRELRTDRLEKIAVSAMKQSLKALLPDIQPMTPFADALAAATARGDSLMIAHCIDSEERRLLSRQLRAGQSVTVFIGPEGDFSPREIEAALAAGAGAVSLGPNRLRTETAALTAATTRHVVDQLTSV